jgi:IMP dehydrogenase
MKFYNNEEAYSFNDVLIRPAYSELNSRQDVNYKLKIGPSHNLEKWEVSPIIIANMKTTSTIEMGNTLTELGIIVPSHRFQSINDQCTFGNSLSTGPIASSIGLNDRNRISALSTFSDIFFLELAHADSKNAMEEVARLKKIYPGIILIVGNVATAEACKRLFAAGADLVKIGIGPGSVCLTRLVTGTGVPQLSAIAECAMTGPIIADGGITCAGDAVKCLAAGAKFIMIGSLFAGTDEAAGARVGKSGGKVYYGMASKEAGKVNNGNIPEGIAATVPYAGSAKTVAKDLLSGIRQGMAMIGAKNLKELQEKAVFQRVTSNTIFENHPHILNRR